MSYTYSCNDAVKQSYNHLIHEHVTLHYKEDWQRYTGI